MKKLRKIYMDGIEEIERKIGRE
jgi:hypothetical protein